MSCSANAVGQSPQPGAIDIQDAGDEGVGGAGGTAADASVPDSSGEAGSGGQPEACAPRCSEDRRRIEGCEGQFIESCDYTDLCVDAQCVNACQAAHDIRSSVGCEYFAVPMEGYVDADGGCFAVFVANTWALPAHVQISRRGFALNPQAFGFLASKDGKLAPYNATDGIPAGQVGIFFLAGPDPNNPGLGVECPVRPASVDKSVQVNGTGIGDGFHLSTDVPVVAYQMLPYGGGSAAVTGASLLLPTSVWDTNYVAVNAYAATNTGLRPSLNLVAMHDGTEVTMLPKVKVLAGGGIKQTDANTQLTIRLNRGQFAQITQAEELTGSPIQSNKPIALFAGHECMQVPSDKGQCDHAEQQIPAVKSLGHEYVAVGHRPRSSGHEPLRWRIIGAVDGTNLTFDPAPVHAPVTVNAGQILEFASAEPFVVSSQDADHPYVLAGYMTGSATVTKDYGDPDFVRMVPPRQYLQRYVFFTDPTYPETNVVVVRQRDSGAFRDVTLDCSGELAGWQPVGTSGRFEYTRADLQHMAQPVGDCDNGAHEMKSSQPFGLYVWGWGTPETQTGNVSYGYPAGESVLQLNNIVIPTVPK